MAKAKQINYREIDANIAPLVRALNAFEGITTHGSCGGHKSPTKGQWGAGTWYVKFEIRRNREGWFALEFLAWLVNNDARRSGKHVILYPVAPPPYLNTPGKMLDFAFEGYGVDPSKFAKFIVMAHKRLYVAPGTKSK